MALIRTPLGVFLSLVLLALSLASCGGDSSEPEDDRSFAPEAQGDVALPTESPAPTSTFAPIDSQPGEDNVNEADTAALLSKTGSAVAMLSGMTSYLSVAIESGKATEIGSPRSSDLAVSLSPDGQRVLVVDRSDPVPLLRLLDGNGKERDTWSQTAAASPAASPVTAETTTQLADRVAWSADSARALIWLSDVGLLLVDNDLNVQPFEQAASLNVTALAFSPSGQSLAIATWNSEDNSSSILSMSVSASQSTPGTLLRTRVDDGRYIRSMVWGNEQVGIVFALRNAGANSALPNDLYMVRRVGEPMQLVASAGAAAPAALIDQVAIAADGQTIAYSVLIPGETGYRLHSVWIADAIAADPVQLDLNGVRRIAEIAWSTTGLVMSGITRTTETDASHVNSVIVRYIAEGNQLFVTEMSAATPDASPVVTTDDEAPVATPDD